MDAGRLLIGSQAESYRELVSSRVRLRLVADIGLRTAVCLHRCTNSSQLMKQKQGDLNLARKSCWFGLGFQKTKTAPRIVSASEGASKIGSTKSLR
ncbi:hypothetical protein F2Q68_00031548 [Brassica cretica]|uniref:Uncharacterized protein n=2 Tax=Brassica cretica TaxID=69181 RepID=A0A8S9GCJ1_BRACR|nr:hypothetical protein F2Q68_00031548 [Brassica cretica]KAF3610491.1 hypothetical protein DY000_02048305 [Brassica cretica]